MRTGVRPVRYDFSEPQAGKDICDRKTAAMKAHIKRWVNERHDVVTAEDMKVALESHGGIKGCRAAVVEVDTTRERNKDNKIPGISLLNNFKYEERGSRVWKAYDIGPGRFIPYSGLGVTPQGDTGLRVIKPFGQATHRGSVGESLRHQSEIYSCQETGCVLTFKTQAEADNHMDTGKRRLEVTASPCMTVLGGNGRELRQGWHLIRMYHQPHCKVRIVSALSEDMTLDHWGGL